MKKTVVVGMSGGVDSSVAALLCKEKGYHVIGLFMRNWEDDEGCTAGKDYEDAQAVAAALDIPCYPINFTKEYWDGVFARCLKEYAVGLTPNPDVLCNREIKFNIFLDKAMELGADYLATGHYSRVLKKGKGLCLGRGIDHNKDQSYFLYTLKEETLKKVLFPIGDLTKDEVRSLALNANLVTANKRDSTGICFVGKRNFKDFLSQFLPPQEGNLETLSGEQVGRHEGIAYYTIGQRKGLGIGGEGKPWYVVGKDVERNVVVVEQGDDHPALYHTSLNATEMSWVGKPKKLPLKCTAKVRYRSADVPCTVISQNLDEIHVEFETAQKAITPRQSIVFYDGEVCLGGAMIK
ncbi:MAG: tRNA-specific 2-thiouridylase MnmA [Chlamydiales bacterium]|nr:tRNA-specific 2-thiouridylase MnmA [Chlamydiales bacterium]MCH9619967.1 tRNA-specific 2-thiouridylase MnmA [Chlamydiales bacterium]MCH9622606.1 tRNA-specific 2-thiouridylase MnmA [Chlamydiales bacterium]